MHNFCALHISYNIKWHVLLWLRLEPAPLIGANQQEMHLYSA